MNDISFVVYVLAAMFPIVIYVMTVFGIWRISAEIKELKEEIRKHNLRK